MRTLSYLSTLNSHPCIRTLELIGLPDAMHTMWPVLLISSILLPGLGNPPLYDCTPYSPARL